MIIETDAIVLHRMKYKNSSLIARLFTKDEGKISIISNGAGKQKGNLFGVIEPPNLIKVSYTKRRAEGLQTCRQANLLNNNINIRKDIFKLSTSLAIVESIDKTMQENDVNSKIYDLSNMIINRLNNTDLNPQLLHIVFALKLIQYLGLMPQPHTIKNINTKFIDLSNLNINQLENENVNQKDYFDIINFFENYINENLKLNVKMKSFNMIKAMHDG